MKTIIDLVYLLIPVSSNKNIAIADSRHEVPGPDDQTQARCPQGRGSGSGAGGAATVATARGFEVGGIRGGVGSHP